MWNLQKCSLVFPKRVQKPTISSLVEGRYPVRSKLKQLSVSANTQALLSNIVTLST